MRYGYSQMLLQAFKEVSEPGRWRAATIDPSVEKPAPAADRFSEEAFARECGSVGVPPWAPRN